MQKTLIYIANYLSEEVMTRRKNQEFYSPAANNKIISIAKSWKCVGYKVIVLSPSLSKNNSFKKNQSIKEVYEDDIEIIYVEGIDANVINRIVSIFYQIIQIRKLIKKENIQGIIFYDFIYEMAYPAFISKYLFRKKILVDYEEEIYSKEQSFNPHILLLYLTRKLIARKIDGAILVSSTLKKFIKTDNYCICRGYYNETFDLMNTAELDKRGLEEYIPTIFFGGKMDRFRGIDILLEAVKYLKHPCRLVLTGYGPDLEKLKIMSQNLNSKDVSIDFRGFISKEVYKLLAFTSDILVNTQRIDSESSELLFPSKIIEYMSTGNIVVSSNVSDISLIAEDKIILYYRDTPQDIEIILNEVLENLEKYRDYGKRGKLYVREHFNYAKYGEDFVKLL